MFLVSRNARYLEELVTHLFRNCSRPSRRSSIKESSNIPSSPRNGSCLNRAFPGRGGTTTYLNTKMNSRYTHLCNHRSLTIPSNYRIISNPMIEKALLLHVSSWNGPLQQQHGRMIQCPTLSIHTPCSIQTNTLFHSSILHLAFSLQLSSQPLKVAVSPPDTCLLQLEDREVCLGRMEMKHLKLHVYLRLRQTVSKQTHISQ